MQKSNLTGAYKIIRRKHYVAATGAEWLLHSPSPASLNLFASILTGL